jgi:hypothetical protein
MTKKLSPKKPAKKVDFSTTVESTSNGGHKWTIFWEGKTVTAGTSGSSVTTIYDISKKFDPALKSLAKK